MRMKWIEGRQKKGRIGAKEERFTTHFSHGRWHEKLCREATWPPFKRSNHDYVKFWSAILPPPPAKHTPSRRFSIGIWMAWRRRGGECENRWYRNLPPSCLRNSILFLSIPPRMMVGGYFHSKSYKNTTIFSIEHATYILPRGIETSRISIRGTSTRRLIVTCNCSSNLRVKMSRDNFKNRVGITGKIAALIGPKCPTIWYNYNFHCKFHETLLSFSSSSTTKWTLSFLARANFAPDSSNDHVLFFLFLRF